MDEMIIRSGFLKGIIGKILKKVLKENLEIDDAEVILNGLSIKSDDKDSYRIHIDGDLVVSKDDIQGLIKNLI